MKALRLIGTAIIAALAGVGFAWAYCSLRELEWPVDISTLPDAVAHRDDAAAAHDSQIPDGQPLPEPPERVSSEASGCAGSALSGPADRGPLADVNLGMLGDIIAEKFRGY